jgi:hypothetical protein
LILSTLSAANSLLWYAQMTALLLALILPCQCMAPHVPEEDVYTPLPQAVAFLDDAVVYDEAA